MKPSPFQSWVEFAGFFLGILFFLVLLNSPLDPRNVAVQRTAAVAALMAVWWMTNAIPIPATSLLPLALFPMLGVVSGKQIASLYIDSNIFLFIGGFLLALAMERWGLHRRIALNIVSLMGDRPQFLILGFMLASACLSAWVSNTATAMMMAPIGMSVAALAAGGGMDSENLPAKPTEFGAVLMLGIAYACSIGGMATLIGTPPNIVFQRQFSQFFPGAPAVDFAKWFMVAAPIAVVFLFVAWAALVFVAQRIPAASALGGRQVIRKELALLGKMSRPEATVLAAFVSAALLWIFRQDIELPGVTIPGWAGILGMGQPAANGKWTLFVDDGTVAIAIGLLLFILPSGDEKRPAILDWPTAVRLPWGIVLLFGGGFALAGAFVESGLSTWIGGFFSALRGAPNLAVMSGVSGVMTLLTELTSNTATTQTAIPILSTIAREIQVNPLLLLIPATLSASCAFMLPVATPPNAIVFASGQVSMGRMIRNGIILNIAGLIVIVLFVWLLAPAVFHIDLSTFPSEWLGIPAP